MNALQTPPRLPLAARLVKLPWRALWLAAGLTALGLLPGVLSLYLSAWSCPELSAETLSAHYWAVPELWYLNLLPGVLLIWLFYFLLGRCWLAYPAAALPVLAVAVVNYYKIQLRGDPLLASDLSLLSEAGNMADKYTLELEGPVETVLLWAAAGLALSVLLLPRRQRSAPVARSLLRAASDCKCRKNRCQTEKPQPHKTVRSSLLLFPHIEPGASINIFWSIRSIRILRPLSPAMFRKSHHFTFFP